MHRHRPWCIDQPRRVDLLDRHGSNVHLDKMRSKDRGCNVWELFECWGVRRIADVESTWTRDQKSRGMQGWHNYAYHGIGQCTWYGEQKPQGQTTDEAFSVCPYLDERKRLIREDEATGEGGWGRTCQVTDDSSIQASDHDAQHCPQDKKARMHQDDAELLVPA